MPKSSIIEPLSIVFLGSGPVAAASLKLLQTDFKIEAIMTKPRPSHHKGSFPVIDLAQDESFAGCEFITVSNKVELSDALASRPDFNSRLGVVIDFGIIISQDVIDRFELGIINSHFSLLPQWRGADPISFSILSGQSQTGVSVMRITAGLDEGPLLGLGVYELNQTETTPVLTKDLIGLSNTMLKKLLPAYASGTLKLTTQEEAAGQLGYSESPSFSHKLSKADAELDFNKPAAQLEREIRAYAGWPGSRTTVGDKLIIITRAHVIPAETRNQAGTVWHQAKQFGFYTSDDILAVDELKPAGKSAMPVAAFLAGYRL